MKKFENGLCCFNLGINTETPVKVEGHIGTWTVIEALLYNGTCYALLEHNTYGDETAYLIVRIKDEFWLVNQCGNRSFYIHSSRVVGSTFDGLLEGLWDYDIMLEHDEKSSDKFFFTREEINNI
jgi:hypothetical protein